MGSKMQQLAASFGVTDMVMNMSLTDLTEADALTRTRDGNGPSISWSIGHLLHYRQVILNLLGSEREKEFAELFSDNGASDGAGYPTLKELAQHWRSVHADLMDVMGKADDALLEQSIPGPDGAPSDRKVGGMVTFLAFHEGYHLGVIGALRKELGYLAPSEIHMRRRSED